jgi:hypothetical protein
MWSDTLLAAERAHLIRLAVWAFASASIGMCIVGAVTLRRLNVPIILWFGIQTLTWGSLEILATASRWHALAMRDVSAATRLDRFTFLEIGLDIGIVAIGVTAVLMALRPPRRVGVFGGGFGIMVQGLGLLVLDLTFAAVLARLI